MATRTREDRRLRLLSAVCLALPEAERTECGAHADFRIHGRIFAYFLRNHNGDGVTAACFKSRLGEHVEHVKRAPDRFYLPEYLGRRGWFGLRLDQGEVDWEEVSALAAVSYRLVSRRVVRGPEAGAGSNALTARSLVRGAPVPVIHTGPRAQPQSQANDCSLIDDGETPRQASLPPAAVSRRSGILRGRR